MEDDEKLDSRTRAKAVKVALQIWPELGESSSVDPMGFPGAELSELAAEHRVLGSWLAEPRQQRLRMLSRDRDPTGWASLTHRAKAPIAYKLPTELRETPVARARTVLAFEERACWLRSMRQFLPAPHPGRSSSPALRDELWLHAMARDLDEEGSLFRFEEAALFLRFQERLREASAFREMERPWPPVVRILRPLRHAETVPADVVRGYMGVLEYYRCHGMIRLGGWKSLTSMEFHPGLAKLIEQLNTKFGIEMNRRRVWLIAAVAAKSADSAADGKRSSRGSKRSASPVKSRTMTTQRKTASVGSKASKRKSKAVPDQRGKKAAPEAKRPRLRSKA